MTLFVSILAIFSHLPFPEFEVGGVDVIALAPPVERFPNIGLLFADGVGDFYRLNAVGAVRLQVEYSLLVEAELGNDLLAHRTAEDPPPDCVHYSPPVIRLVGVECLAVVNGVFHPQMTLVAVRVSFEPTFYLCAVVVEVVELPADTLDAPHSNFLLDLGVSALGALVDDGCVAVENGSHKVTALLTYHIDPQSRYYSSPLYTQSVEISTL